MFLCLTVWLSAAGKHLLYLIETPKATLGVSSSPE